MKIYKSNNKLILYLPFEVIKQLGLKGEEEVDFFKFNEKAFLFAKKEDITNLITGTAVPAGKAISVRAAKPLDLSVDEVGVLKKLDTLRYLERTATNVGKMLSDAEKKTLQGLIGKNVVAMFKDKKEGPYSISKEAYDKFLMRKKPVAAAAPELEKRVEEKQHFTIAYKKMAGIQNESITALEKNGFIVLNTEAEASSVSLALEDSVRHGLVLGTRAFNKRFYIVLRDYFGQYSAKVIGELKAGPKSVEDISKKTGIDEDAVRAMLYLLAEQGDVSERRRDVFALI
ncbi:RNA polymerase III subunit RPC82 helix-turn-helix domain protein [uncultured archaeon]|nr:RNA polymerase III subunit RPC82 helix-turn-helix domain protein [uncultured archaeon]